MPLTAHPHPPPRPRAHPHRIFLRPRRHPRPHPTLVADSLTFTSTPALAPARSPSPHSTARADVGCSARVWARLVRSATPPCRVPIGRGCSAREGVIWSAGLVAPRCCSATLVDLRAEGLRRRLRRRVPVNPGRRAGNSARDCRWACGAGRATIDRPPRLPPEAWSRSCLKRRPDPARRPRPRPGGSRVTVLGRTKRH